MFHPRGVRGLVGGDSVLVAAVVDAVVVVVVVVVGGRSDRRDGIPRGILRGILFDGGGCRVARA